MVKLMSIINYFAFLRMSYKNVCVVFFCSNNSLADAVLSSEYILDVLLHANIYIFAYSADVLKKSYIAFGTKAPKLTIPL